MRQVRNSSDLLIVFLQGRKMSWVPNFFFPCFSIVPVNLWSMREDLCDGGSAHGAHHSAKFLLALEVHPRPVHKMNGLIRFDSGHCSVDIFGTSELRYIGHHIVYCL